MLSSASFLIVVLTCFGACWRRLDGQQLVAQFSFAWGVGSIGKTVGVLVEQSGPFPWSGPLMIIGAVIGFGCGTRLAGPLRLPETTPAPGPRSPTLALAECERLTWYAQLRSTRGFWQAGIVLAFLATAATYLKVYDVGTIVTFSALVAVVVVSQYRARLYVDGDGIQLTWPLPG